MGHFFCGSCRSPDQAQKIRIDPGFIILSNTAVTDNTRGSLNQVLAWFLEIVQEVRMYVCEYTPKLLKTIHICDMKPEQSIKQKIQEYKVMLIN